MLFKLVLTSISLIFSNAFAYEARLSFYTFENKGTPTFGKIVLGPEYVPIPITIPWFDWKCSGQKQVDGMLISCERGDEKMETKIFCYVSPTDGKVRSLRFAKGTNFVSIEGRCRLDKVKNKKIKQEKKSQDPKST